jgi:3-phosphoshikimate 1-carboxyvinyltransferase
MRRITEPLRLMGAEIEDVDGHAPLTIQGRALYGYDHILKIASAQVKSALLLAGLYADGVTIVRQPGPARDHTERMLAAMGGDIRVGGLDVSLEGFNGRGLQPIDIDIPGDLSSAAFPLVAALITSGAQITLEGVGVNPTRTGFLDVLEAMGADFATSPPADEGEGAELGEASGRLDRGSGNSFEPRADIQVRHSKLAGVEVRGETVVRMIDEFPILAVAATQARGTTLVRDATELRVKETDRIATIGMGLQALGADIEPRPDGFVVRGPTPLQGAVVNSHGDHRMAMALAIAGLVAGGETVIENAGCIRDSFPGFVPMMESLGAVCDYVDD